MEQLNKVYRLPQVVELVGLSPTTIWRKENAGTFPPRRKLSNRLVGWLASDIQDWLESLEQGQRAA